MSDFEELISELEKSDRPDRGLDAEVAAALGHEIDWQVANYTMESFPVISWKAPHPYVGMREPCPKFTASIDAASVLLPERAGWNLQGNTSLFYATVKNCPGKGSTAAIALTIACMRALASTEAMSA